MRGAATASARLIRWSRTLRMTCATVVMMVGPPGVPTTMNSLPPPSIVLDRGGKLFMVVGTPGWPTIITTVAQVILNVRDQRMSLADAVAAPRIHHQALPDVIHYERDGLTEATVRALEAMGHKMEMRRGMSGIVAAIQHTAGGWIGVADPRYAGGALGY